MLEKPVKFTTPKSNSFMKKRSCGCQVLLLHRGSLLCSVCALLLCFGCFIFQTSHLQRISLFEWFKPHRTHKNQPLSFPQPMALEKCSCALPCVLYFLGLLHDYGSLCSIAPMIHFSPKSYYHISYILWCDLFYPFSCEVCLVSLQVDFGDIWDDLIPM